MRPRVKAEFKGLKEKIKEHLEKVIEEKGALSERELWEETLSFFLPDLKRYSEKFRHVYRKVYGRKIGKKTAEINVIENLRRILSNVKKEIPHTEKPVVIGRKRFGRIFYRMGREGEIVKKVREIVSREEGRAKEVLEGIERGPFPIDPSHRKAAEMLEYYGLAEIKKIGGKLYAVEPGFKEVKVEKGKSRAFFPPHFTIFKPFKVETLIIRNGPEKIKIKFDIAAWDPVNKVFYLGMVKDYVDLKSIEAFIRNYLMLKIPAKLVIFCKNISEKARKEAEKWGIDVSTKHRNNQNNI